MRLLLAAAVPLFTLVLPMAAAQAQAPGSYRGSCTDISQNGPVLSARCRGSSGRYNDTSINLDQCGGQPVANSFGRLTCGNVRGASEPTPGGGDDYVRPRPRPRYDQQYGDSQGYGQPAPGYGPPPGAYYRQVDPGDPYAPRPPRPRRPRYDPDQDY